VKNLSNPPTKIIRGIEAQNVTSFTYNDSAGKSPNKGHQPQMTASDIEQIQLKARQEAYEEGRKEGFEFGQKEIQEKLQQLDQLIQAFQTPFKDLDDQVETEIVDLVISMVRQLVRREVKMDPNHIVGVVREALAILPVSSQGVTLVLNPADAKLIREAFSIAEQEQSWKINEDPVLERGGCKVLADESQIDATLESRLDALIAPLLSDERMSNDRGNES